MREGIVTPKEDENSQVSHANCIFAVFLQQNLLIFGKYPLFCYVCVRFMGYNTMSNHYLEGRTKLECCFPGCGLGADD